MNDRSVHYQPRSLVTRSLTRPTLKSKQDVAQRLCGSLQVDIEKTRCLLGWTPPLSLDEGLRWAAGGLSLQYLQRQSLRLELCGHSEPDFLLFCAKHGWDETLADSTGRNLTCVD